jgi:hypothetical protein
VTERERLILIARAKQKQQAAAAPQTNLVEQVGTGTSEGIAGMAGLPVDALTGALNWAGGKLGMPPIENPIGGSGSIEGLLDPFMSDVDPQTAGQRIGRRVGQDVGAGAVAAPVAGISSLGGMGLNAAADASSGLAGGATSEVTDSPIANLVASLLAGGGTVAGAHAMRSGPHVPSTAELKTKAGGLYKQVEESDFKLNPDQVQELQGNISARMHTEDMDPPLHPRSVRGVNRAYDMGNTSPDGNVPLNDVEKVRRFIGKNVVPAQEPGEQGLGLAMKDEIDKYIDMHAGDHPDVDALKDARATTRQYKGSEALENAASKAALRAAVTGIGGNGINTIRQNLRGVLENPKLAASFTPEQKKEMLRIAEGTTTTNALRAAGSLAPQRGALGITGSLLQAGAANNTGNMWYMVPSGVSMVAHALGEVITKKQADNLAKMVRNGGPVPAKTLSEAERSVLNALLAAQSAQQGPQ